MRQSNAELMCSRFAVPRLMRWVGILGLAGVSITSLPAQAQATTPAPTATTSVAPPDAGTAGGSLWTQPRGLVLELGADLIDSSEYGDAPGLDGTALVRVGLFELGVEGNVETQVLGYWRAGLGGTAGVVDSFGPVTLELRGDVGQGCYTNVGGGLFTTGASGCVPYAGARLGASIKPRSSPIGFGAWVVYTHDLATLGETTTTDGIDGSFTQNVEVGSDRIGVVLGLTLPFL
jgi:hypothetical protein